MITPNKVITLEQSALGLTHVIIEAALDVNSISELQRRTSKYFESIDQFLLTLDVLFVLGKITVDFGTGRFSHAD